MIRRLVPRGLRGRLLLAFVVTSALTLAVATGVVLGPLREQLRQQSVSNLEGAVTTARADFNAALRADLEDAERDDPKGLDAHGLTGEAFTVNEVGRQLRERTDARVLVGNPSLVRDTSLFDGDDETTPGFFSDTEFGNPSNQAVLAANRSLRLEQLVTQVSGDDVTIATPLYAGDRAAGPDGVLVAQRRLTEVTTAVEQVRNALLAAAIAGLVVALGLGIALSNTLLRRLGRLRAAALRITHEGPDAPAPRDEGRDEVGDLARALARMQEELRRQEAARRSFVATASHELRTPLTMLQGTMELLEEDLRDGVDIADAQVQVTNARRELRRLSALAGELLDLSRLDADVQLRSEPVELGELARAVAAEFHVRADERDAEIDVVPPREGCWGRGDPDAVARVVRILIDNALRYGPPGEAITVSTTCAAAHAGIQVSDRGPGIPEEEREQIFERFHRGRAAGSESGFGLGLAIGRELAVRMGGSLRLTAGAAPGACFELVLPAAEPETDSAPRGRPGAVSR
jgi:signal transduction histidine kinase